MFWAEYSTAIKLGIIEDPSNRARLAKLLKFESSGLAPKKMTALAEYVERMPENQDTIYYMAAQNREEVCEGKITACFFVVSRFSGIFSKNFPLQT